mmetsp:Transcript_7386/g.19154  ORF Transcript_7386/g.19154 Transcript_7386/m.19154 type:complete len:371 (-) Transcript_7386:106-1218(-)
MTASGSGEEEHLEKTREQLLKRNRKMMIELGIPSRSEGLSRDHRSAISTSSQKKRRAGIKLEESAQPEAQRLSQPVRRSAARIAIEKGFKEVAATTGLAETRKGRGGAQLPQSASHSRDSSLYGRASDLKKTDRQAAPSVTGAQRNSGRLEDRGTNAKLTSSRSCLVLNIAPKKLLPFVWKQITPPDGQVKRAAMAVASPRHDFVFNKMSGIASWANALYLFVNIDPYSAEGEGSHGYKNCFSAASDGTVRMVWYAQSRMSESSKEIQVLLNEMGLMGPSRVVEVGGEKEESKLSSQGLVEEGFKGVHLFFRTPSSFYIYAGRCKPTTFHSNCSPLSFDLLLDLPSPDAVLDEQVSDLVHFIRRKCTESG